MDLSNLKPAKGSTRNKKRVGRGPGSTFGRTAGRGNNGYGSRSGSTSKIHYEGGQTPLMRRLPKRGFTNINRSPFVELNFNKIEELISNKKIDPKCNFEKENLPGSNIHYKCKIDTFESPDLCDHLIRESIIFPAAGYIELLLNLKQNSFKSTFFSDFEILMPLKLDSSISFLNAILEENKFKFYSQDKDKEIWKFYGKVNIEENTKNHIIKIEM